MHIKQVDADGRFILPQEYRKALGISDGGSVVVSLCGEKIEIARYQDIHAAKRIIEKTMSLFYGFYHFPIAACDEEKIISTHGLHELVRTGTPLDVTSKNLLEQKYEYIRRRPDDKINLIINNDLTVNMMAPFIKDGKAIGAVMLVGRVEPFEAPNLEAIHGIKFMAALIKQQISTL